jgi:hypothetical protein
VSAWTEALAVSPAVSTCVLKTGESPANKANARVAMPSGPYLAPRKQLAAGVKGNRMALIPPSTSVR